ncbi:hypothetical protein I302_106596 [Kwoniella bestiolae CBS 10118]|uniref:Ubiquitin-conjugating enzyme 4 n=1 Tax=Kwoniella bestiolae CBS 10118 TaxID=1296100 RepID=A0A1B9G0Y9_9TREE|nr:ubiquitin-conjugating enzyme 4 [Kwoniella bestiolae CBS 10118]OCF24681.1 ubiquitin-conjugating enzyme 4 [Kwoniella bestiolae CBS 10118]
MPPRPSASAPGMATKRIKKEIADLSKENLGAISLQPNESNIFNWKAILPGPTGSPYEGGVFEVDVKVPEDYPFSPPHLHFVTKVYHCNIASTGAICLDLLKHAWSPALSLYKVILSLSSLLTDPNPSDPLVPAIAQEYKRDRKKHDATAREWVKKYATPKQPPPPPPQPQPQNKASSSRQKILNRPSSSTSATPIPHIAGTRRPASTRDTIDLALDSNSDDDGVGGSGSVQVLGNTRSTVVNGTNSTDGERRTKRSRLNNGGGGSVGDAIVIDE